MLYNQTADDERLRRLSNLLKDARRGIPVNTQSLGNNLRFPGRVGKRVSQEEVAEAIGVSRNWYSMLETGRPIRASVALLERICNVLTLDERQRASVFELGIPEIPTRVIELRHSAILEASTRMRSSVKRLWSTSTVEEALSAAAEESSRHFDDAELVFFVHRVAQGRWDHPFIVDRGMGPRNARFYEELAASLTPARFDEVVLYPALSEPGDVGTLDSYGATSVADLYETERAKHKLHRCMFLHARIRSRMGVIGGITIKHAREHEYSEVDRAVISAIASLTSLALS
jgi:transcriptional regulator with XRE-family HTH domain